MRFTTVFALMAAGSAIATDYAVPGEETTTTTQTTTRYITVTKCADTNPNCPLNQPSATPEPVPTYAEPEVSSAVVESSASAVPEVPEPSSAFYPVHNATTHVNPTGSVPQTLSHSASVVVSSEGVAPTTSPTEVAGNNAAGLSLKGGLLAGMVAFGVAALL